MQGALRAAVTRPPPFRLGKFMAGQADGALLDFTKPWTTWQDTAGTTPAAAASDPIGRVDDIRTGAGSPHTINQSSASLRPLRSASLGATFDNTNDVLVSDIVAGVGANFILVKATLPGSIGATQYIAAALDTGPANRFGLAVNTSGRACAIVGTQSVGTIFGGGDLRGLTVVFGMTCNATTVRLFSDISQVYSAAQSGTPTTSSGLYIGALNNAGTAAQFFAGSIQKLIVGREYLTLAAYLKLRTALLAA